LTTTSRCASACPSLPGSSSVTVPGQVWRLTRDGELLATLEVTGGDFPWLHARFQPAAGFEEFRPLFAEELRLIDDLPDQVDAWEAVYQRIRHAVTVHYPDGRQVPEFLLHVEGDEAWWRWSDEPFEEDAR
jgi:Ser/Thr protein kinase RdoA (MazF antagonist)